MTVASYRHQIRIAGSAQEQGQTWADKTDLARLFQDNWRERKGRFCFREIHGSVSILRSDLYVIPS
jgi:hypothetical protein